MKSLIKSVVIALAVAAPVASFAQSNAPVTRAQLRAELVQLEKAGYNPVSDRVDYPARLQAAQARVAAQNADTQGYGGTVTGSSQSGQATDMQVSSYSAPIFVRH